MNIHFLFSNGSVNPILWDGKARFDLPPGSKLLNLEQFEAWSAANPVPVFDPRAEKVKINSKTEKWEKQPLTDTELAVIAAQDEAHEASLILEDLKQKRATNPQIQTALTFILSRLLAFVFVFAFVSSTIAADLTLTWKDNSTNEKFFSIERSTVAAGPFVEIHRSQPNATTFADTGLPSGTTHYYRMRAVNDAGASAYTPVVSGTTTTYPPIVEAKAPTPPSLNLISENE